MLNKFDWLFFQWHQVFRRHWQILGYFIFFIALSHHFLTSIFVKTSSRTSHPRSKPLFSYHSISSSTYLHLEPLTSSSVTIFQTNSCFSSKKKMSLHKNASFHLYWHHQSQIVERNLNGNFQKYFWVVTFFCLRNCVWEIKLIKFQSRIFKDI